MGDESELRELAAGLRSRQRGAWDRLYVLTHLPILRMLRRMLRDDGRAEDALQATFVTAIERIRDFDPKRGMVDSWLVGIARFKAKEAVRGPRALSVSVETVDPEGRSEISVVDHEMVALALDHLDPRYAEVLRRKYIDGQTLEEIASDLKLKATTIGTLLHRGKEKFKEAYGRLRSKEKAR
jgi:RNA polymerase sigma-70 factor (ECF subfamily)